MLKKLVRTGLVDLIAANFLMQFVGFGVLLVLPRFLDAADFGQIRVLQGYGDLLVILAGFGMNTAVLKACAGDVAESERHGLLRYSVEGTILGGVLVAVAAGLAAWLGAFDANPLIARWMPVFAWIAPLQALGLLLMAYLQSRARIKEMARAQLWVRLQSAVVIVLATWAYGTAGFVAGALFAAAVALGPYLRLIGLNTLRAMRQLPDQVYRSVAGYSMLGNLLNTATKYADLYVLGLFATNAEELGYYATAAILVLPGSVITSSIQSTSLPLLAQRADERTWFTRAVARTQLQTFGVAIGAALGIRILAPFVIDVLYDPAYRAALPYLDVLLLHYVLRSAYAVLGAGHIALGRADHNFWASAIGAPVALTASYLALDAFGTAGIAWAKTGTAAILILIYGFLMRRAVRGIGAG